MPPELLPWQSLYGSTEIFPVHAALTAVDTLPVPLKWPELGEAHVELGTVGIT